MIQTLRSTATIILTSGKTAAALGISVKTATLNFRYYIGRLTRCMNGWFRLPLRVFSCLLSIAFFIGFQASQMDLSRNTPPGLCVLLHYMC